MGDAGKVEGEPQPPHTGQHALAPTDLAWSGRLAHVVHATVVAMAKKERLKAPEFSYGGDDGTTLVLRGSMTPATRLQYADVVSGNLLSQEDAWHRSVEFLFERLVVRWEIVGTPPIRKQKELLARFRFASQEERVWIRGVLREHLAEHFPEMQAP
jgi:hypothetical protein